MQNKFLKIASFIFILFAYTFHPLLWDYAFYHLTALTFVLLTRLVWRLTKDSRYKLVALVMHITAINNLIDELFFDPTIIDYNEYLTLLITVIVVYYNKEKWMN
jgi:lipoprotein signal peptidase